MTRLKWRLIAITLSIVFISCAGWSVYTLHSDTIGDGDDPYFVCGNPGYLGLSSGMTPDQVKHVLGPPPQSEANPDYVKRTPADWKRIEDDIAAIGRKINPALVATNVQVIETDPAVKKQWDRQQALEDEMKGRVHLTWLYEDVPGWHGGIEVYFDDSSHVIGRNCGYG